MPKSLKIASKTDQFLMHDLITNNRHTLLERCQISYKFCVVYQEKTTLEHLPYLNKTWPKMLKYGKKWCLVQASVQTKYGCEIN